MTTLIVTTKYDLAHRILGLNSFFSPERIERFRTHIKYPDKRLEELIKTLPEEDLSWCKSNGFMLVAPPPNPMSLSDVFADRPSVCSRTSGQHELQAFTSLDTTGRDWMMFRGTSILGSVNRSWDEQILLLSEMTKPPSAAELAWLMTTHRSVCAFWLFRDLCIRTSSTDQYGNHICLKVDGDNRLCVKIQDNGPHRGTGIASMKKRE